MDKKILFPILIGTLLFSSCSNITLLPSESEESESDISSETEDPSDTESETGDSSSDDPIVPSDDLYELFYDHSNKVDIKLDFTNEVIYKLAKYSDIPEKKDMYHPVDVTITINDTEFFFEECGARMKGNTSRNPNFVDENGQIQGLVHFKISFNQTFDDASDNDYYIKEWESDEAREARKDRRFAGAKKFDIKWNKSQDNSFTKQMYAYDAFRESGVLVERNNLVKTTIKTESDSVTEIYLAQECVDKEFIKRRLPKDEAKGNLYKSTYTSMGAADFTKDSLNRIGVEAVNYSPSYDLKTNDDPDEIDHTLLQNLISTVNDNKSDAATFKPIIDNLIDVDAILKYLAVAWVMGNPDDSRHNYNNYYIYFNSVTNKAVFIPYDYDRCLGILQDWEIHMEDVPYHTTKSVNREWQRNPLLWRLILRTKSGESDSTGLQKAKDYPYIEQYRNQYIDYCTQYANEYLSVTKFQEYTNDVYYANKDISNPGGSNMSFENYATTKLNTFNKHLDS